MCSCSSHVLVSRPTSIVVLTDEPNMRLRGEQHKRLDHSVPTSQGLPRTFLHLGLLYHTHRSASSPILSIYRISSHYILLCLTTTHRSPRPTSIRPRPCPPRSPSTPPSPATSRNLSSLNAPGKSRTRVSPPLISTRAGLYRRLRRVEPLLWTTTTDDIALFTLLYAFPTLPVGCAPLGLSPWDLSRFLNDKHGIGPLIPFLCPYREPICVAPLP